MKAPLGEVDVRPYIRLVREIARQIARRLPRTVDLDDLIGAGMLGLLNASKQYDPSRGVPFDKYAEIMVRGAILDELRKMDPMSRGAKKMATDLREAVRRLAQRLGRSPEAEEVASSMGVSVEDLHRMSAHSRAVHVVGFEDLARQHGTERHVDTLPEMGDESRAGPEDEAVSRELADKLIDAVENLTARERQVVTFYYFEGILFTEIARLLEITEGRVSQLHSAAIRKLRTILKERGLGPELRTA